MALLRFAKKKSYGLATSTGMMFGHYVAWIAAGIMGAGAAVIIGKTIVELRSGRCCILRIRLVWFRNCNRSRLDNSNYQFIQSWLSGTSYFP